MHGGSVTAQSEGEGRGSQFTVRLPLGDVAEQAQPKPGEPHSGGGRRILVVDDNVGTATILARLLKKLGEHEIRTAHDGAAALEAARIHQPELILLDIGLPRMNGYEVARRLRQQPEFRRTLLVALTGYGTEDDRTRAQEAGFDRHLTKPPSMADLRQILADPRLA